jgi:zinc protease
MRILPWFVPVLILSACGEQPQTRQPAAGDQQPAAAVQPPSALGQQPVAAPFPHQESGLAPDPAVRWGSLPNGARYALMASQQPAGRVSLRLRIASGSLLEDEAQRGLAHMLEHMAFNGSRHYAPGALIPALQSMGIGFGNHLNAHTGFDETVYKVDLPDAKEATLDVGLTVLADQAGGLLLDAAEVERERGVVLAELRDRDGPGLRLQRREMALLTAGTRIGDRLPIGHAETIAAATPELLRAYYRTWYRPERMVLSVVGDVDLDLAETRVKAILGTAAALAPAAAEPAIGALAAGSAAAAMHDAEAEDTDVRITGLRQRELPVDSIDARREQFFRDLGEAVLARRLGKLVESDPACPLLRGGGFSYQWLGLYITGASGTAKPGRALDALRLLATEYRRLAEHGPTDGELAIELTGVKSGLDQAVAQQASRRNDQLAGALYDSVADRRVFRSPAQERELGLALCAAATPTAVRDAVRQGWDARVRTVAIVTGKDDLGADGDAQVASALAAAMSVPVEAPKATAAAVWAYAVDTQWTGEVPARSVDGWAIGAANGLSLAAKRTDFQPGQVILRVRLPVRTGPRQPGIAELAGRSMVDGGLGKHPASQLAEVLAGSTVRFGGLGIEDGALVLNAACAPKDLRRACELVKAWIEDAAWRPEAEARAKTAWMSALEAEQREVEAMTWRRYNELCLPDDAWRRAADKAHAEAANLTAVKAWLAPLLAGSPMGCTVVGDIAEDEALRTVAAVLGGTRPAVAPNATPAEARAALPPQPAMPAGEFRLDVPSQVAKAMVIVSWPTDDQYDIGRSRRLGLLGRVFNERVREVVREQFGDAYSPGAWAYPGDEWRGHGNLTASIGVGVPRVDAVRDAVLAIADGLAAGIDPAVLDRVRTPMLRSIAEQRRQNGWWLGILSRGLEQPFRLEWQKGLEADLQAATAGELAALAKTYLVKDKALIVIGVAKP